MSSCCSCCKQQQQQGSELYTAATRGPEVSLASTSQVHVTFDTETDTVTSQVTPKNPFGFMRQLTTYLAPNYGSKSEQSTELHGIGYTRQSSRYDYGFTKDYLSGRLKFTGSGEEYLKYTESKYMVVQPDEDKDVIVNALAKKWKLHLPKLLICILGGDQVNPANQAMVKAFCKGLVEAVLSTDVWLFTGGLNCGMMASVGQALTNYAIGRAMVKHRNVVAVGVAPLGILKHKEKLLGAQRKPVMYDVDPETEQNGTDNDVGDNDVFTDKDCSDSSSSDYNLEPNHTHFILVGDEESGASAATKMRNEIVKNISKCKIEGSNATVPALYVVFGGGILSIQTVFDAVTQSKIPVLVIPGSGGAADVLAFAINSKAQADSKTSTGEDNIAFDVKVAHEIRTKLNVPSKYYIKIKDQIKEIIKRRRLINVYNKEVRCDEALLQALMNANQGCKGEDDLHLAAIWNKIDLAKKQLLKHRNWKDSELKQSFYYVLVNNQHKFVKLFIDEGNVDLKKFLTVEMLTNLYNQVSESSVVYSLLNKERIKRESNRFSLKDVSRVLKSLIFDTYEPVYDKLDCSVGKTTFRKPLHELFVWAILQHRFQMAKIFWKHGKPSIASALLGSKVLKALSDLCKLDSQESALMYEHGRAFETMAIEILNLCYIGDRRHTSLLLVRNLPDWGNSTCIDLAATARNKRFIAHAAVQNLLNELWMGRLSCHTSVFTIWFCICIPIAPLFMVTYMSKDDPSVPARKTLQHQFSEDEMDVGSKHSIMSNSNRRNNEDSFHSIVNDETDGGAGMPKRAGRRHCCSESLPWWYKLKLFHEAPVISFRLNMIAHFAFLALFSYILLSNFWQQISYFEMVLIGWVFTLFTEEVRQLLQEDIHTGYHRFNAWLWGYWNCIDLVSLVMYAVGLGLRFHPVTLDAARIILALDLIVFYLRILHIFSASKFLGPKLIMIMRMTVNLVTFLAIFLVFLISYGVACQAILFPNTQDFATIFKGVVFQSYFQLYGELFLDEISGESCEDGDCPQYAWFGLIILALYLFISNILLLNLLIAMLNYTFYAIQENTDTFWKFQRYQLVKEYYQRPSLVPPLIIVSHTYQVLRCFWDKCFPSCKLYRTPNLLKKVLRQEKQIEISIWEDVKGEEYLAEKKRESQQDLHKKMKQMEEKFDVLSSRVSKCMDGSKVAKALESRFNTLEAQISNIESLIANQSGVDLADSSASSNLQGLRHHPTKKKAGSLK